MKWDPDSIKKDWLIAEGDYDFEVIEAEDQKDQWEGNPQIFIKFRVFLDDGNSVQISQFIRQAAAFLVDQLARAVGLDAEANAGEVLAEDLLNRSGRGHIHKREKKSGDKRNEFNRFHPPKEESPKEELKKKVVNDVYKEDEEDDIPF